MSIITNYLAVHHYAAITAAAAAAATTIATTTTYGFCLIGLLFSRVVPS